MIIIRYWRTFLDSEAGLKYFIACVRDKTAAIVGREQLGRTDGRES